MSKNCVLRSYADNLLKFRVHPKQSEMQTFETIMTFLPFLFTGIALPLNNNICLSVCFFRMLSDNPLEIIGSEAFSTDSNLLVQVFLCTVIKENDSFLSFFYLTFFVIYDFWNISLVSNIIYKISRICSCFPERFY